MGIVRYIPPAARQQVFTHKQLLCSIVGTLVILSPAYKIAIIGICRRPFSGNILSDLCCKAVISSLGGSVRLDNPSAFISVKRKRVLRQLVVHK